MTPEVDYFRAPSRARSFLQTAMAIAALSVGAFILVFILPAACALP